MLVGPEGAEAAWLVLQYASAESEFMRDCRTVIEAASQVGQVPRWQCAYLDDRMRVFEGRLQRFGTRFYMTPASPEINELEDPGQVDLWRREVGFGPVGEVLSNARDYQLPTEAELQATQARGNVWRRKVGCRAGAARLHDSTHETSTR